MISGGDSKGAGAAGLTGAANEDGADGEADALHFRGVDNAAL